MGCGAVSDPQSKVSLKKRSACLHHRAIDPPAGPVSKGTCRSCGEERGFPNYVEGRINGRVDTTEGSSTEEEERGQQAELSLEHARELAGLPPRF